MSTKETNDTQYKRLERKRSNRHNIAPNDSLNDLREPLHLIERETTANLDNYRVKPIDQKKRLLAAGRVARDNLMRKMEDLILKEAELASAYELFDYSRQQFCRNHEDVVAKLNEYEEILLNLQQKEIDMASSCVEEVLHTEKEKIKWKDTQNMVKNFLPELLSRLEEKINLNTEKIRHLQLKMEEIRAQRLAVREEITCKEKDISLALALQ
jgi:hypothetical protein